MTHGIATVTSEGIQDRVRINYSTPSFPSLYWPFNAQPGAAAYLYATRDIWRFTLLWTLIIYGVLHLSASAYAIFMQPRPWKMIWLMPVVYTAVGGIEAMLAGSVVGLILSAVYHAGFFSMSTWIPFVWALVNVLVVVLASFSIQGGL